MMKMFVRTVTAMAAAFALVLGAGAMGAAQAHHSTAHSIGTQLPVAESRTCVARRPAWHRAT